MIILDSNILFSALIKDSITRKIILNYNGFFYMPSFVFDEINKHKKEIFQKSGLKQEEFGILMEVLLAKIRVIPKYKLLPFKNKSASIARNIDPNDAVFIASVLAYPGSILWSDDKNLKKIEGIRVLNTKEIIGSI